MNNNFLLDNLIAHRGIHDRYLENSLDAILEAVRMGYIVEIDIHLTKDGIPIVFHDDSLMRIFGIHRLIRDMTIDEIKKYRYIPTLEEVLELVNGKVPLIIEFKFDNKVGKLEREAVKLLDKYKGKFAIWSFSPLSIFWFRIYRPKYVRGYLINGLWKYNKLVNLFLSKKLIKGVIRPMFLGVDINNINDKVVQRFKNNHIILGYTFKTKQSINKYKNFVNNFVCDLPFK